MASSLPRLTAEQRRAAAGQFERAGQVSASGNFAYAVHLLRACCRIDPGNMLYRQTLRQAEKSHFGDNRRGHPLAFLLNFFPRIKLEAVRKQRSDLAVLEFGERILQRNPWDVHAHLAMAEAFDRLDLSDQALWTLEQIRQIHPEDPKINRPMAKLLEDRGNFSQAIVLWEQVRKAQPNDLDLQNKIKDLSAHATIAKGKYDQSIHGEASSRIEQDPAELAEKKTLAPVPVIVSGAAQERRAEQTNAIRERIRANPKNPNGYMHLAGFFRKQDRFEEAAEVLREGLPLTGNHFDLAMELLDLEIEPMRRDLAVCRQRLLKTPNDPELQRVATGLQKEIASRELEIYQQKSDRFPTDTSFRFELAVRLWQLLQLDEAIRLFQILRADPRHQGRSLVYLGFCFQKRKNWRLAELNFTEALKHLSVNDGDMRKEILYSLATGSAEAGDWTRAVDLGLELANLDYSYKGIGQLLDQWNAKVQKV